MNLLSMTLGVLLLLWTIADVFSTVFVVDDGAGRQSGVMTTWMWRAALRLHDPSSARSHRRLRTVGPLMLLLMLAVWVGQLILAWALVFIPSSFGGSTDVSFADRISFAGRSVIGRSVNSTLLQASSGQWEAIHGLAGLSGITMVSIALAYVLPILAAVAHKRAIGVYVDSLGITADDARTLTASASNGGKMDLHILTLAAMIATAAERHRAYPVLHYFHSVERQAALGPAIAKLSLLVDSFEEDEVDSTVTRPLARIIHQLLSALSQMGLERYARASAGDAIADELEALGSGSTGYADYEFPSVELLQTFVAYDGWRWDDVTGGQDRFASTR